MIFISVFGLIQIKSNEELTTKLMDTDRNTALIALSKPNDIILSSSQL